MGTFLGGYDVPGDRGCSVTCAQCPLQFPNRPSPLLTLHLGIESILEAIRSRGSPVKIGDVAQQAGVRVQTLRYYERCNLVPQPERRPSGYREYPAETVQRVQFIKRAQRLGFTLDEIRDLLRLRSDETADCSAIREAAAEKAKAIREKIRDLRAIEASLRELVESCRGDRPTRDCSILGALEVPARERRRTRG